MVDFPGHGNLLQLVHVRGNAAGSNANCNSTPADPHDGLGDRNRAHNVTTRSGRGRKLFVFASPPRPVGKQQPPAAAEHQVDDELHLGDRNIATSRSGLDGLQYPRRTQRTMACQAMATVIRTPFLYLASYIPAATVMMMPGQFKRAAMDGWVVDGTISVMKFQKQVRSICGRERPRRQAAPTATGGAAMQRVSVQRDERPWPISAPFPSTAQMGAGTNWVTDRIVNLVTDLCDSDFYFLVLPALLW